MWRLSILRVCGGTVTLIVTLAAAGLFLAGCAGLGRSGDLSTLDIATRFLPMPATVPHADSLQNVQLQEDDGRLVLESELSFGHLWQRWSSGYRVERGTDLFEAGRMRSFATLWGRELRLKQFDQRTSVGAYAREEAEREIASRVDAPHAESIVIDVHVYIDRRNRSSYGATSLRSAGWTIFLRTDDGDEYQPESIDATWAQPINWSGNERAHYRQNTLRFERVNDDGEDILHDTRTLELHIRDSVASTDKLFGWRFDDMPE